MFKLRKIELTNKLKYLCEKFVFTNEILMIHC